ncbi:MAG: hypothetical protein ACKVQJ_11025 [Pyrinomonadaceae bacterium]
MKNILLIVVCLIVVLGCDISKFTGGGKNGNNNSVKPSPTAEPKPSSSAKSEPEKTPSAGVVDVLKNSKGKYPYEIKLLENPELKSRLQKLLGADYAAFKANWDVETPVEIENGILMASGCEQHNCGDNIYYLFVDLENDNINVFHRENGVQSFAERGKINLPKKFADELGNDK